MDDAPVPFGLEVQARGARIVVVVRGEVDAWTAPGLTRALAAAEASAARDVEVDMAAVRFIDSSGILALVRADEGLAADGRTFSLRRVSGQVRRVLVLTGLADHFGVDPAP